MPSVSIRDRRPPKRVTNAADVAAVLQVAERWKQLADEVTFAAATSESERQQIFAMRYQKLARHDALQAAEEDQQTEFDAFDATAILIAGKIDETIVSSARIVLPDETGRLPATAAFDLQLESPDTYAEIGRVVVSPVAGLAAHRLFRATLAIAMERVIEHGFVQLLATANRPVTRIYRQLGIEYRLLLPDRTFNKGERFPVAIDTVATARGTILRSGAYSYLA